MARFVLVALVVGLLVGNTRVCVSRGRAVRAPGRAAIAGCTPTDAASSWLLRPVQGLDEVDELIGASESIVVLPQAPLTLASTRAASAVEAGR